MAQPVYSPISRHATIFNSIPSPVFTFIFIILLCMLGFYTLHHPLPPKTKLQRPSPSIHDTFLSLSSNSTLSHYLRSLTLHPHLAGTAQGRRTAQYVLTQFKDLGLETHLADYQVLLSYPTQASLSAHFSGGGTKEFELGEMGRAHTEVVRPYHAYSPSGTAEAKAVFVNYGREEDYSVLGVMGVKVKGCIVIARRGEGSRNAVVTTAEENGAVAVLMYTEGDMFVEGVERGTVMRGVGDPLSPGWASVLEGSERLGMADIEVISRFPEIPSMPISAKTAESILESLEGPKVPQEWRDALKTKIGRVGPGPTVLNFTYQGEEKMAVIQDVFAIIRGMEEPDRYVLLGNHRDAWTYGAVDPNSGTAALLDIARRYALLMGMGWKPRRTIVFCSWDAEEFGMIGSTEWVEQNLIHLGSKAVAYLNVDCAVQGPGLFAGATPQLDDVLVEVTKKVKDPDVEGTTVYEQWTDANKGIKIQRLSGVDSDFAPFLQHAGVPSVDIYYGKDFPVYHTAFDSYDWMVTYGDPFFHRHVAVSGIWGLLALHLADDPVLPFNYVSYAAQLQEYIGTLSAALEGLVSLDPITAPLKQLSAAAREVEEEVMKLRALGTSGELLLLKRRMLNDRLVHAEKGLLDADGLRSMRWFKHLVYGPCGNYESNLSVFPGISDAIYHYRKTQKEERKTMIQHEIWKVARAIQRAADALRGQLF
ncbi:hypothetical protein Ancab_032371 [Ancistrocladus abbreviatus]